MQHCNRSDPLHEKRTKIEICSSLRGYKSCLHASDRSEPAERGEAMCMEIQVPTLTLPSLTAILQNWEITTASPPLMWPLGEHLFFQNWFPCRSLYHGAIDLNELYQPTCSSNAHWLVVNKIEFVTKTSTECLNHTRWCSTPTINCGWTGVIRVRECNR